MAFLLVVAAILAYIAWQWPRVSGFGSRAGHALALALFHRQGRSSEGATAVMPSRAGAPDGTAASGSPRAPAAVPPPPRTAAPGAGSDYFATARLEREQARSQAVELLQEVARDAGAAASVRQQAQERLIALSARIDREAEAETLLKGKGYADALVFLNDNSAVVVLRAKKLQAEDVARAADAVAQVAGLPADRVNVMVHD